MGRQNVTQGNRQRRRRGLCLLLWAVFGSGLLVQALAPRLRIANRAFVIPPSAASRPQAIDPAAIIAKERFMQLLSAILTVSGALGLGLCYRPVRLRAHSL